MSLLASAWDTIGGLSETFVFGAIAPLYQFFLGAVRLSWPFIFTMALVAYCCFLAQRSGAEGRGLRGFLKYLRIREVFLHRSALVDYRYWLLNGGLKAVLISPALLSSLTTAGFIEASLVSTFGANAPDNEPGILVLVAYSLAVLLAIDLGNYWSHRLHHEIPVLWELHKVHHSAEVLNPTTAERVHPLESLMNSLFSATLAGVVLGVFSFFWTGVETTKLFGLNIFMLLTHIVSGNLRHSHIWFSYGPRLEHIVSSPAQHQIHHSDDPKHFDKNYAVHFSFWDWLFGSLYTTTPEPEKLNFGIGEEGRAFNSVIALWSVPLKAIAWRLRGERTRRRSSDAV